MASDILVAEDNALNFELIRDALQDCGHAVDWARDGKETLEQLERNGYRVLFLDLHMPGLDGYEVLRSIRSNERFANIRIVVITADVMGGTEDQVLGLGADAMLAKPLEISRLCAEAEARAR